MHNAKLLFIAGGLLLITSFAQSMEGDSPELKSIRAEILGLELSNIRAGTFALLRRHIDLDCTKDPLQQSNAITKLNTLFNTLAAVTRARFSGVPHTPRACPSFKLLDKPLFALEQFPLYAESCIGSYIGTLNHQLEQIKSHDEYVALEMRIQSLKQLLKKLTTRWEERIDELKYNIQSLKKACVQLVAHGEKNG